MVDRWTEDAKRKFAEPDYRQLDLGKATTVNVGVDLSFLNSRLNVSGDAYVRNTTDMLVPGKTLPAVYGAASPQQNAGDLRTKGYELVVSWKDQFDLKGKPFNYGVSFVLGDAVSEITRYDNPNKLLANHYEGKRFGEIWGYGSMVSLRQTKKPQTGRLIKSW